MHVLWHLPYNCDMSTASKTKNVKIGGENNISFYAKFDLKKTDDEKRMVYGYCTSEAVDSQGEIVSKEAIRNAWKGYMEYGNIREMHQPSAVGVTKEFAHDENGTWIGVKVVDGEAWEKVKEGVYKGFSIGGRVVQQTDNIIEELILSEISLVDRPANPNAKFTAIKVDDGLVSSSALEAVTKIHSIMNKFVEIDGIKYKEDPANAGQPLLVDGEKVLFVEDESAEEAEATEETAEATEETAVVADAAVEETTEETQEESTEATEETAEVATEETADATASEAEKEENAVDIKKDTDGVITMVSVLYDLEWAIASFASSGKDVTALEAVKAQVMEVIAAEATEKEAASKNGGMSKADLGSMEKSFGSLLEKALAPFAEKFEKLANDVEVIKGTKVSKRPTTAVAVEKGFVNKSGEQNAVDEAKSKVDEIAKEINAFSDEMHAILKAQPERQKEMEKKSTELLNKFESAKRVLNAALAQ